MNQCQSYVQTIKRLCNRGNSSNMDVVDLAWDFPAVYADIQATTTANSGVTNVEGTPQNLYTANVQNGWRGLILADNDCIYSVPNQGRVIHKIDATTDTVTTISVGEKGNCFRGCFAKDRKIYMPPYANSYKLRILDTTTDTLSSKTLSSTGFGGSFCNNEGVITSFPGPGTNFHIYNSATDSDLAVIPDTVKFGGSSTRFAVTITATGFVVSCYNSAYNFLVYEEMPTWSDLNNSSYVPPKRQVTNSSYKNFINGILAADGKIYNLRDDSGKMIAFDLSTEKFSTCPSFTSYTGKIGYDNSIYMTYVNNSNSYLGKYNIGDGTITTIGSSHGADINRISGMALWKKKLFYQIETGSIYVVPLNVEHVFQPATLLSQIVNRP